MKKKYAMGGPAMSAPASKGKKGKVVKKAPSVGPSAGPMGVPSQGTPMMKKGGMVKKKK